MIIRPMTGIDRSAIVDLLKNTPEFTVAEVALAEEVMDAYLSSLEGSGYFTLVAEMDKTVAGYICYGPTPITESTWDIYWIAVDRNIQGRGIGRKLMNETEQKIRQAGGRLIMVETSSKPGYEKTNAFYLRMGYAEICRIKDFYAIGDDQIVYEKRF